MKETVDAYSESDILACVPHLSDKLKIAVGYCWGGSLAWRVACRYDRFDAAICYYGGQLPSLVRKANLFGSGAFWQKGCVYTNGRGRKIYCC